jgi:hypothetical protein
LLNIKRGEDMIRKALLIVSLVIASSLISGCSSDKPLDFKGRFADMTDEERQQMIENRGMQPGRFGNLSDEERQQMMEEKTQTAKDACAGMGEGDICILESPLGQMNGTCSLLNESLICRGERMNGWRQQ